MNDSFNHGFELPPEQQAIRDRCFHTSGTFVEFPIEDVETSIPARFEKIAGMYPERIALKTESYQLTYDELNRAANRLARVILAGKSRRQEPVALFLENSVSLIIANLAVLKSGNIAMHVDPLAPASRISHMMADSQDSLVLTNSTTESIAHNWVSERNNFLNINEIDLSISDENLDLSISPDAYANIAYTSGSTGKAKGALKSHRSLLHSVIHFSNSCHICAEDRLVIVGRGAVSKYLFIGLLNGARQCLFDIGKEGLLQLADKLIQEEITVLMTLPTAFRHFLSTISIQNRFPKLRLIRFTGEPTLKRDVDLYQAHFTDECLLVNTYAAQETSDLCLYFIDKNTVISGNRVPVGYPKKSTNVYIIDELGNELSCDQPGQIVVQSGFLPPGYLMKEDSVSEDISSRGGKQYYQTGDIGIMSANGCLVLLGRKDTQVKIRSYRVDIGEVEATLTECPGVKEASVVANQVPSGDTLLAAYVVCNTQQILTVTALRNFLAERLPEYMVPAVFTFLPKLPLTATGKVDRRALPDITNSRPNLATPYVEPRTTVEKELALIWSEILSLREIGIHDNFFELGGHSLAAMRVVSRVIIQFQLDIPMESLFQSPTVAEMAAIITKNQTKHPGELQQKRTDRTTDLTIPRRGTHAAIPLSFAQQRLWFLSQLEPESCTYNETSALRLDGELNINALHDALNAIVERHEVLRTTYGITDDGAPVQIVNAVRAVDLPVLDISEFTGTQQDAEVQRLALELKTQPFDLSRHLPLRLALIRLSSISHVLVAVKHHIASDGWSRGVFFRELANLYQRITQGETTPLPELPIQYADYAVWQREWLQGEVLEKQLAYWKGQLEDVPILNLPTDRPRGASVKHSGAKKTLTLSKTLIDRLKALSSQQGVTLFMTLLAAFQVLLHRYTGQDDIAVGSPIAGRTRAETEGLIGFFVNTLVLRTKLADNPKFNELLARVRNTALQAYEHQDIPFEKLVEELNPERNQSQTPLFQVSFAFQNVPRSNLDIPELKVTPVEIDSSGAKFDMSAAFIEHEREMTVRVEYRTELFEAATIARMFGHFRNLLEGIVADPDRPISDLPILTESEKHQLLVAWNETKADYPKDYCIHDLFEEQVEKTPDKTALVFEDRRLTYRELNTKANQLAHYLSNLGVGPDDVVGLCMGRSVELVIGLLGILKAGGAYVPLDPAYPKDRIAYILEDTQASILLTEQRLIECSSDRVGRSDPRISDLDSHLTAICLDSDWNEISRESCENLQNQTTASNLAYLIYTSGSTGLPKGVMIEHRNAVAFLSWAHSVFAQEELAGVIALTSICFDLSIFELLAPLTSGGRVILMENALALSGLDPALEPTLINTVPSVMIELLRLKDFPTSIRTINLAGEPLNTSLVQEIYERTSAERVYDLYGPSETTTYSTYGLRTADGRQTIGRPIGNTQVYILDPHLKPVPIGVAGELHIAGDGVARGYLNRPELTKEKFIANPFSADPASRLYKTGDRARYLTDGNIDFIGRMDTQVKIRGYRIELGEVEAVLGQHPAIRDTVVLAREDVLGDRRLVAYVVARVDISTYELRSFLKQKLPDFMVPSAIVLMDSLPLTPNGKVDRRALPKPSSSKPELDETLLVPRTPTEELLANIWAEVLKLEKVGIHDNFFDLGGHSLLATRIVSKIREVFRIELPLRALFEKPTVFSLSDHIVSIRWARDENKPTSIEGVEQTEEIIL